MWISVPESSGARSFLLIHPGRQVPMACVHEDSGHKREGSPQNHAAPGQRVEASSVHAWNEKVARPPQDRGPAQARGAPGRPGGLRGSDLRRGGLHQPRLRPRAKSTPRSSSTTSSPSSGCSGSGRACAGRGPLLHSLHTRSQLAAGATVAWQEIVCRVWCATTSPCHLSDCCGLWARRGPRPCAASSPALVGCAPAAARAGAAVPAPAQPAFISWGTAARGALPRPNTLHQSRVPAPRNASTVCGAGMSWRASTCAPILQSLRGIGEGPARFQRPTKK